MLHQLVTFTLDGQPYALPLASVQQVVRMVEVVPLPKAPEIVLGVINLHGKIVPVLNLRKRFGLQDGEASLSDHLLSRIIPDLEDWKISILATDLNTRSLYRASEGIYTDWSFRDTPPWVKSKYFKAAPGGRWAINPAIKKMVTFAYLNLIEDVYLSLLNSTNALDVILCRNVLMYLTPEAMKKVIHQFYKLFDRPRLRCNRRGQWKISPGRSTRNQTRSGH